MQTKQKYLKGDYSESGVNLTLCMLGWVKQ